MPFGYRRSFRAAVIPSFQYSHPLPLVDHLGAAVLSFAIATLKCHGTNVFKIDSQNSDFAFSFPPQICLNFCLTKTPTWILQVIINLFVLSEVRNSTQYGRGGRAWKCTFSNIRKPLLGVCILAQLRIKVLSQPFYVDQLNPAGFNVPNVLIKKTPALFLRGKLEI